MAQCQAGMGKWFCSVLFAVGLMVLLATSSHAQFVHSGDPDYKGGFAISAGSFSNGLLEATVVDSTAILDLSSNYGLSIYFDLPVTDNLLIGPRLDFVGIRIDKIYGPDVTFRDISDSTDTQTLLNLSVTAKYAIRPRQIGWAVRPGVGVGAAFLSDLKVTTANGSQLLVDNSSYFTGWLGVEGIWYAAPRLGLMIELRWLHLLTGGDDLFDIKTREGAILFQGGIIF